jgi:hypothetical protein
MRHSVSVMAKCHGDLERIRSALTAHGVVGVDDFGYFVNNSKHLRSSSFDERAAMPVLLDLLPTLSDPKALEATARHLRRPWAKSVAFSSLLDAFRAWAPSEPLVGWVIGDALASAAGPGDVDALIALADDQVFGMARQMIVYALWRFRRDHRVSELLTKLANDPEVYLHAMTALRRAVGSQATLPILRELSQSSPDPSIRKQAAKEMRRAERESNA